MTATEVGVVMLKQKINLDLKKLSKNQLLENLSQHLNGYEKRVRTLVKDFDLRSRDAREKSKHQLDLFAERLREARGNVETKVAAVLNQEGQRLNKGVQELLNYLKTASKSEKLSAKVVAPKKRSTKAVQRAKKSTGARKSRPTSKSTASSASV